MCTAILQYTCMLSPLRDMLQQPLGMLSLSQVAGELVPAYRKLVRDLLDLEDSCSAATAAELETTAA